MLTEPQLSEEDDREVLSVLQRIFEKHSACLRRVKKPPKWAKSASVPDPLTAEEEKQKQVFKSMFVTGANTVIKGLESDNICLVLMCSKAQPAVLKQAVLSLVISRQCPAACVSHLLPAIQKPWPSLTSLTAFGIKKTSATNDFTDLIQFVKTTIPQPEGDQTPQLTPQLTPADTDPHKTATSTYIDTKDTDLHKPPPSTCTDTTETVVSVQALDGGLSIEGDTGETKPKPESDEDSVVDPTKYYIYKHESSSTKAFDGQDFLSFDKEVSTDKFIDIKDGKVSRNRDRGECVMYGIAPPLCSTGQIEHGSTSSVFVQDRKRVSEDSTYKGIRIKQAKRDMSTPKQKRKKEKRETKEMKKKMKNMKKAKK